MVESKTVKLGKRWILYNPSLMPEPRVDFFDCQILEQQGVIRGRATGRGDTCFYDVGSSRWALRHYLRGGVIAKLLKDKYLGLRITRSRAWKEWSLLQQMADKGLPVPVPVAASVIKKGLFYQADLVTEYIHDTQTLADRLETAALEKDMWKDIGACIQRFHQHSVYHSDLNAKNILIDKENKVYLIDFDQCSFKQASGWKRANLERLKRSLDKFVSKSRDFNFSEENWQQLMLGYQSSNNSANLSK